MRLCGYLSLCILEINSVKELGLSLTMYRGSVARGRVNQGPAARASLVVGTGLNSLMQLTSGVQATREYVLLYLMELR